MKASIVWRASLAYIISPALAMSSVLDALTIPDLATAANNSLFEKWRPTYHFIGPNSWQNDPCTILLVSPLEQD
jgi:beta-fructofuranosidase